MEPRLSTYALHIGSTYVEDFVIKNDLVLSNNMSRIIIFNLFIIYVVPNKVIQFRKFNLMISPFQLCWIYTI